MGEEMRLSLGNLGFGGATGGGYVRPAGRMNALFVGQSVMARGFTSFSGAGATAFEAEATALGFTDITTINGALDSAGVCFGTNSTAGAVGSYLADGDLTEGTIFTNNLLPAVTSSGVAWADIDVVFYMIGNRDRLAIQGSFITEAQHKAGYKTLIDLVRARATNAIHIQVPNIGNTGLTITAAQEAWTAVERAQYEVMTENSYILPAMSLDDIPRGDPQHPTEAGHELQFERFARLAAHYFGETVNNPLGASIASATYNATSDEVTVNITHDDGTDFTISDSGGYWVYVNGTYQKPTTAARLDATSFKLSGSLTIDADDTVTLSYAAGTHEDMTIADIFLDNATNSLSLRHTFGFTVTDATPAGGGGFSPDDLTELKFWADPSDGASVTESGGNATVLDDKSGGTDMTAVSAAAYGTRTINSLNVLDFDKGEYYTVAISSTGGVFGSLVMEFDDETTVNFIRDANNSNSIRMYTNASGQLVLDLENYDLTGSTVLSTGTTYIISFTVSSAGAAFYLDGALEASSGSDPGFTSNWDVIGGSSFGYDGAIGEIVVTDASVNNTKKNQIGNYLADKWDGSWTDIS
jgi:hypothetical protein